MFYFNKVRIIFSFYENFAKCLGVLEITDNFWWSTSPGIFGGKGANTLAEQNFLVTPLPTGTISYAAKMTLENRLMLSNLIDSESHNRILINIGMTDFVGKSVLHAK